VFNVARKAILTVIQGPSNGKQFAIENGFVVGRGEEANIDLGDQSTSRKHAQLTIEREGIRLADLDSANGIFVNKRKVKSHFLVEGDEIMLGDSVLKFSMPIDPKARRRNLLIFTLLLLGAAGGVIAMIVRQNQAQLVQVLPFDRTLDLSFTNEAFGFSFKHPSTFETMRDAPYLRRAWAAYDDYYGYTNLYSQATPPKLGNQLVTDKVILDGYYHIQLMETVNENRFEFLRFDVEVWDGIAAFQDINDFSLTDKTLTAFNTKVQFTEEAVVPADHPEFGRFEEGELNYKQGTLETGEDLFFYVKQRCYVVGKRRFLISASCNYRDAERAIGLFNEMIDSFAVVPATHTAGAPLEVLAAAKALMEEGQVNYTSSLPHRRYQAMLLFMRAANMLKQLPQNSTEYRTALRQAQTLQDRLQKELEDLRKRVQDNLNRQKWDDAYKLLAEIVTTVDDNNSATDIDTKDEWRIWQDIAKPEVVTMQNQNRFGQ